MFLGTAALLLFVGCATTEQTRSVEPSGFLKNYSQLQPGKGEQALLVYMNPEADFSGYESVMIDPVTIWHGEGSELSDVPDEDLQRLANHFHAALRRQLGQDFAVVEQPGRGTLRIRTAITEVQAAQVVLNTVSTLLLLSEAKKLATGTQAFVGRAAIEIELLDSLSQERLAAAVDERAGGRRLRDPSHTWADVEEAFDYWADVLRARLSAVRDFDKIHH
jgi:hypothetical protein